MVALTRLDGSPITVHAAHIVSVETTPDTLLVLHNGGRLLIREPVDEVCHRVRDWCRAASCCAANVRPTMPSGPTPTSTGD